MSGVFCNQCGHRNPAASNFCSSCGAALEPVAAAGASARSGGAGPGQPGPGQPVRGQPGPGQPVRAEAGDHTITFQPVEGVGEPAAEDPLTVTLGDLPDGLGMLIVKRGPNAGSKFVLDSPVTAAGRHPASDIFLDDITVSRRHAEFRREGGAYRVVDVGSLNGTYVNRERTDDAALLHGDEIQIGKFKLVLFTGPEA